MRERWVDDGQGLLTIHTDTVYLRLWSKAYKNYRHIHSNWTFSCAIKGQYGYVCRFYHEFGGTFDEALDRAETIMNEVFESFKEIF